MAPIGEVFTRDAQAQLIGLIGDLAVKRDISWCKIDVVERNRATGSSEPRDACTGETNNASIWC